MAPKTTLALSFLASATLIASAAWAEHVREGGWVYTVTLTGAAEVPGPGDPDGSGTYTLTVNPGQKRVCYDATIAGITAPTAAHIHKGSATVAGPVFIGLGTPPLGTSSACFPATSRQLAQIIAKPQDYYVNVHTVPLYAAGAIRGQLARPSH
jgi:hypothetical protein